MVAGRVDLIGEFDGELSIIDFKTSKRLKKREYIDGYFMQSGFYAAAFYEMTGIPIKKVVILITVDDELPQVFTANPFDWLGKFLTVRKMFRAQRGI